MNFATGRYMRHGRFSHGYEVEDVVGMVRLVFGDRVRFHAGSAELAPGLSVHHIGGHTMGLQCVRVATARGWLVLASDCSHYYEHMETGRVFPTTFHVGDTVEGYDKLRALAESPGHIIPGHDPLVMKRYPAPSKALEGIAVRLDVPPVDPERSEGVSCLWQPAMRSHRAVLRAGLASLRRHFTTARRCPACGSRERTAAESPSPAAA